MKTCVHLELKLHHVFICVYDIQFYSKNYKNTWLQGNSLVRFIWKQWVARLLFSKENKVTWSFLSQLTSVKPMCGCKMSICCGEIWKTFPTWSDFMVQLPTAANRSVSVCWRRRHQTSDFFSSLCSQCLSSPSKSLFCAQKNIPSDCVFWSDRTAKKHEGALCASGFDCFDASSHYVWLRGTARKQEAGDVRPARPRRFVWLTQHASADWKDRRPPGVTLQPRVRTLQIIPHKTSRLGHRGALQYHRCARSQRLF